jgi:hypothetical protein
MFRTIEVQKKTTKEKSLEKSPRQKRFEEIAIFTTIFKQRLLIISIEKGETQFLVAKFHKEN